MLRRLQRGRAAVGTGRALLYEAVWHFTMALLTLAWRLRRFHIERIPDDGPVLLVANHQSFLDPPIVAMCIRHRHMHPVARVGLFKNRLFGWFIASLNSIPIREDGGGDIKAMKDALERLEKGAAVLIFPEGLRTPDGEVKPFKRGVSLLVKRAKCPVVPIAIEGAFEAWPRTRKWPRMWGTRVAALVGEPIAHEELVRDGAEAGLERLEREVRMLREELRGRMGWG